MTQVLNKTGNLLICLGDKPHSIIITLPPMCLVSYSVSFPGRRENINGVLVKPTDRFDLRFTHWTTETRMYMTCVILQVNSGYGKRVYEGNHRRRTDFHRHQSVFTRLIERVLSLVTRLRSMLSVLSQDPQLRFPSGLTKVSGTITPKQFVSM